MLERRTWLSWTFSPDSRGAASPALWSHALTFVPQELPERWVPWGPRGSWQQCPEQAAGIIPRGLCIRACSMGLSNTEYLTAGSLADFTAQCSVICCPSLSDQGTRTQGPCYRLCPAEDRGMHMPLCWHI